MWRSGVGAVLAALFAGEAALAQTGRIVGRITSAEGAEPVPGVQVIVLGTSRVGVSRDDGRYSIAVEPGTYQVRAVRLGFAPDSVSGVTVAAGGTATADFTLRPTASQLSGVVVVGYGTQDVRDRTGVIERVDEKTFNTGRIVSPEQLIQAKVAGVQVVDNNEPGGGISVRIRGGTSITSSNEPLFVVDGVPLDVGGGPSSGTTPSNGGVSAGRNPLNFLNPSDIASITVLKDASATAIYGSRGANGVVLITTKSANQGLQITFGSSVSSSRAIELPNVLNAEQFRAAVSQFAPENTNKLADANTDWVDAIVRQAGGREHSLAVAGAREDMRYRLSLGYLDQDGILQGTTTKRASASLNYADLLLRDQVEFTANLKGSRTDDLFSPGGLLGLATGLAPTQPIRTASGGFFQWSDPLGANNPLADLALVSDEGSTFRSIGNIEARYSPPFVNGLTGTIRTGFDFTQAERTFFSPSTAQTDVESSRGGRFDRRNPRQNNALFEVFGTYDRKLDGLRSNADVTAGYTYEESKGDFPSFFATGLTSDLLGPNGVPSAEVQQNFLDVQESRLISGFGRVNFSVMDRYLFTASVRRDGSSRFGPGNQWGTFPSAAFGWRLIDEPFMRGMKQLSDLKLRVSWGVNGNQAFPNYLFLSTYTGGNSLGQAQFGNDYIATIRPSAVDPDIKWEQTTSTDVGLDYGLFDGRVSGTIDWYTKKTEDLIFNVPVAAGTNLSNFVTTNIGSMENRGVEFSVNVAAFQGRNGDFSWDIGFNASTNKNKLLGINPGSAGTEQVLTGRIAGGVGTDIQVLQPGFPINSFFVYRHKNGADGKPVTGNKPDIDMYVDQNADGTINQADRVPFQSPQPKWIFGHTSSMAFRQFDLNLTARAYRGNYVYNNIASNRGTYRELKGNAPWNLHASVLETGFVNPQYFSDLYVEDASFVRLDNVTLGYTFRQLRSFKQLRLYGSVQNVFTSTKYSGIDPLAGVNGIDNNLYPLSRTFTTGINVGF
jgi:TonB-dependent starch-binding outer membrane protein SusC